MMHEVIVKIPSPMGVFIKGMCFFFLLAIVTPVNYWYWGTLYSLIYIFSCVLTLLTGIILGTRLLYAKSKVVTFRLDIGKLYQRFKVLILFVSIGVFLRLVDRFVYRGVSLSLDIFENRDALEEGANIISILSSFLYPMGFLIPFYLLLIKRFIYIPRLLMLSSLFLTLFPVLDSILFGSRSTLLTFFMIVFFYFYALSGKGFGYQKYLLLIFISLGLILLSGLAFDARTTLMGMDPIDSTQISVYAFFVPLSDDFSSFLRTIQGSFLYFLILGFINFFQYMVHGFFEMLYLVDNFDTDYVYYGYQNFNFIYKFLSALLNIDFDVSFEYMVRRGSYSTLFGPIFYDFGFFGFIFCFVVGFFSGLLYRNIVNGKFDLIPLYIYSLLILFFSFVVNFITFAQGLYYIVCFLLFYFLIKFKLFPRSIDEK